MGSENVQQGIQARSSAPDEDVQDDLRFVERAGRRTEISLQVGESNCRPRERKHSLESQGSRVAKNSSQHQRQGAGRWRISKVQDPLQKRIAELESGWAPNNWKPIFSGAPSSMSGK